MNIESLKIFCCVADELSITRAAERLGRAPSNVTTRIQQLESEVATDLFVRINKRLSLSHAGEQFLEYAKRLIALEEEAKQVVLGEQSGGSVRMGSMESTAASRLPQLLADFTKRFSQVHVSLKTAPSSRLIDEVQKGLIDCAFVALHAEQIAHDELDDRTLNSLPVWQEDLVLLLPPNEAGVKDITQLETRTLAAFASGCTYRKIAETVLDIDASSEWCVQELNSYHAMIACVAAGHCVTLLPRSVLELSPAAKTLASLNCQTIDTYLVWRQGHLTPALSRLIDVVKDTL
ncbi:MULTISPECIES: LysR family transcriptional regulator [Idiomarina]|jgi:DNA-binding transcriptional LysR family regulator|uniref:LysR family transcriptional regulator n=2 Tax=Idiomarina baltica TaxID=190892 RepID=A0A348WNH0_9GAMM|nr:MULTISPECIES: LysR family transcriptional regulator [Idiomarina]MAF75333.1 LysR family transcriptional regulator [Idiomarinaceae bacterium]MEC8925218.1 LysR family transcriptional regulator [Pseudomonadota bacterium]EAQ32959.1 probable transcriptional regulator [Idiomarina baltica OS145]NQZ05203.1 LysR family transcriptional regulator [Idiomarina sp.]HAE90125.1 LysR family transcriptional regulator [Idiomarina sp.]|tara:strand:- start:2088 stop:2960 length:873 start_codon:yes stop_codon:yes gene_type:complete